MTRIHPSAELAIVNAPHFLASSAWCCLTVPATAGLVTFVLLLTARFLAVADDSLSVSLINYSTRPVHATAISLDEHNFRGAVRLRRADNAVPIPLARGVEDGRAVVRLF